MKLSVANRLALDYRAETLKLPKHPFPIIDVHCHLNAAEPSHVFDGVRKLFGVSLIYSMTQLEHVQDIAEAMGSSVRFIAVPRFRGENPRFDFGEGFSERLEKFYTLGSRIAKFWAAPRVMDFMKSKTFAAADLRLDSPMRRETMQTAARLGMVFMVHVGDPDTWFKTKYTDSSLYGSKLDQYAPLESVLEEFKNPWIAAHMGGWPEDLDFLSSLLARHSNLHLDTSATKWMVRELSKHPRAEFLVFLERFRGRILFGSDIVVSQGDLAGDMLVGQRLGAANAFELYSSRYWALRTLFETDYRGESPIVDPDLHMVEPQKFSPDAAPMLLGKSLPEDVLESLYFSAAHNLLEPYFNN